MREEYVLQKIRELLDERGWTLYRLAKEAGVSYSTLSNTFQRENVPSIPTLIQVCEGFGITLTEFFDEDGEAIKQLTVTDQKMLADFHRLPKDHKKLVEAYMQGLLKVASASFADEDEMQETEDQD